MQMNATFKGAGPAGGVAALPAPPSTSVASAAGGSRPLDGCTSKFSGESGVNSAVKGCGWDPDAVRYRGSSAVQPRWASSCSTPAMSGALAYSRGGKGAGGTQRAQAELKGDRSIWL